MGRRVRHFNPGQIDGVNYALDSRFIPQQGNATTIASITARKGPSASQSDNSRRATYATSGINGKPAFDCGTGTGAGVKHYNLSGTVQTNPTFTAIICATIKNDANPNYTHMMGRISSGPGLNPQPCNSGSDGPGGASRIRTLTDTPPFTGLAFLNSSDSLSRGVPLVFSTSSTAYSAAATSMFINGASSVVIRNSAGATETEAAWPSSFNYDNIMGIKYGVDYFGSNCFLGAICTAAPVLSNANRRRIEQHYAHSFSFHYG